MDRTLIALLAASTLFAGVIALELQPSGSEEPPVTVPVGSPEPPPPRPEPPRIDGLIATAKERPLFSVTRRPAEKASPSNAADPDLSDVRLAGIIVEPERHIAIFAVSGAKPLVRFEGEEVKEWRLDSISSNEVSLSGPGGVRTLAPKPDPQIVRQLPAAVAAIQGRPAARGGANTGTPQLGPGGPPPFPAATTAQPAPIPPTHPQAGTAPAAMPAPLAPMPRPNPVRPPQ